MLLVLLAVLCYGFAANVSVPLQQALRHAAGRVLVRNCIALAMTRAVRARRASAVRSSPGTATAAVVALGALGTGVAFVAMGALIVRVGAARGAVAIYFVPVVAVIAGVVFRDEHVAALSLVGMALVVVGAMLTSRADRGPGHRPCRLSVAGVEPRAGRRGIRPRCGPGRSSPSARAGFAGRGAHRLTESGCRKRRGCAPTRAIVTTDPASVPSARRTRRRARR